MKEVVISFSYEITGQSYEGFYVSPSITQEREKIIDFTHSFYETHLAIAVKQHGILHAIKTIFSNKKLYGVVGIIVGVAALIGGILFPIGT